VGTRLKSKKKDGVEGSRRGLEHLEKKKKIKDKRQWLMGQRSLLVWERWRVGVAA